MSSSSRSRRSGKAPKAKSTTTLAETATTAARIAAAISKEDVVAEFTVTGTTLTSNTEKGTSPSSSSKCLHCNKSDASIQVSCDECNSYICNKCHWCHEFQANHEIRVCDRCDAFYCRHCDEMDQCDDCSEVVCASCSTLLSCKFCGGGLCEECATACGRCGIVLCARDAKFAVECDTCKLSYCLVCLASGTKDPCVRCGHRPSKRVEQLVHLRLKSIYKAFKQSGAHKRSEEEDDDDDTTSDNKNDSSTGGHDVGAVLQAAAAAAAASTGRGSSTSTSTPSKKESTSKTSPMEKFRVKQAEADAAAAALLAELEEEEIAADQATRSKKSKKKRKKERQQQAKQKVVEKKKEDNEQLMSKKKSTEKTKTPPEPMEEEEEEPGRESDEDEHKEEELLVPENLKSTSDTEEVDLVEKQLGEMVDAGDEEGIEALLASLRGVPGRGPLRKNAKKALKRLREAKSAEAAAAAAEEEKAAVEEKVPPPAPSSGDAASLDVVVASQSIAAASDSGSGVAGYKPPEPLLKVVSHTHRPVGTTTATASSTGRASRSNSTGPTQAGVTRAECVMQMSPTVVGWVIGKGGQRIRDLMEESGAKVWIDQDSMKAQDPRIVYVSGTRKSVDAAVRMIKDLVAKAPVGGGGTAAATTSTGTPTLAGSKPPLVPDEQQLGVSSYEAATTTKSASATATKPVTRSASMVETSAAPHHGGTCRRSESDSGAFHHHHESSSGNRKRDPDWLVEELPCEARFVPLLIGRRGWTIKHIQDSSGARVDIDQTVTPRKVKISGKSHCVRSAKRMVSDVLSYPHAQLHYHTTGSTPPPTDEPVAAAPVAPAQEPVTAAPAESPAPIRGQPTMDGAEILKAALKATTEAAANEANTNGDDSSPPVSLNIKSTISASSSLSSTPEPSMASSLGQQYSGVPPGPLISPEYVGQQQQLLNTGNVVDNTNAAGALLGNHQAPLYTTGTNPQLPISTPGGFSQSKPQTAPIAPQDHPAAPPMLHDALGSNNPAVAAIGGLQSAPQRQLQGSIGMERRFVPEPSKPLPLPVQPQQQVPMQQQQQQAPPGGGFQQQLLFQRRSSAPVETGTPPMNMASGAGGMIFGNADTSSDAAFGLWARDSSNATQQQVGGATPGQELNHGVGLGGYGSNGYQESSSNHQGLFQGGVVPNSNDLFVRQSSAPMSFGQQNQDDSNMVDNLFGPTGGGTQGSSLLGGLQSLSLNGGAMDNWGSAIPGWGMQGGGTTKQPDNHGGNGASASSSGFAQQPPAFSADQGQQQPQRSRLADW